MPDREKVMSWLEGLTEPDWRDFHSDSEVQNIAKSALALLKEREVAYQGAEELLRQKTILFDDAIKRLKEQETKPLRCKECSYHRNDGWCNEHGREVKESDYCSFGAWEGR